MSFSTELQNKNNQEPQDAHAHDFDQFIKTFIDSFDQTAAAAISSFQIELIATSPESEIAKAIVRNSEELLKRDLKVRAIFAFVEPSCSLNPWLDVGSVLSDPHWIDDIRWTEKPELLDAHEQVILGHSMSWSGDALRRHSQAPYMLDIFESDSEIKVRMGRLAFESLWKACSPISTSLRRKLLAEQSRLDRIGDDEGKEDVFFKTNLFNQRLH
ncbi:MAG: hypothetical protein ACR2OW_02230 [Methyloligellaceae bacterium]